MLKLGFMEWEKKLEYIIEIILIYYNIIIYSVIIVVCHIRHNTHDLPLLTLVTTHKENQEKQRRRS